MDMKVTLMRIDTRLVHGQVATKWSSHSHADNIIVVDTASAANPIMKTLFRAAAPKSIKTVEIYSPEGMMEAYNKGELPDGKAFILFQDVANCYKLYKLGFPFEELDIGNQASKPGKKQVLREVFLSMEEYEHLKEMNDAGVRVYIQIIPEQSSYDFKTITSKMTK